MLDLTRRNRGSWADCFCLLPSSLLSQRGGRVLQTPRDPSMPELVICCILIGNQGETSNLASSPALRQAQMFCCKDLWGEWSSPVSMFDSGRASNPETLENLTSRHSNMTLCTLREISHVHGGKKVYDVLAFLFGLVRGLGNLQWFRVSLGLLSAKLCFFLGFLLWFAEPALVAKERSTAVYAQSKATHCLHLNCLQWPSTPHLFFGGEDHFWWPNGLWLDFS